MVRKVTWLNFTIWILDTRTVGIQMVTVVVYDVTRATLFSKINILFQETRKGHMATTFSQIKVDSSGGDLSRGDLRTLMDESDDYDNGN